MNPLDIWTEERSHLQSVQKKAQHIKDAVRGVLLGYHTGLLLWGEGGSGKSYTVLEELRSQKASYLLHNSRMTARGLVDTLEAHPESCHVLEDCETLLDDKKAWGVLRSALWSQSNEKPMKRWITWNAFKTEISFCFTGGLILISNADLTQTVPEMRAIKSRITVLGTNLTNDELLALMRKICRDGYTYGEHFLTPSECWEIGGYIKERLSSLRRNLDLRLLLNGFKDYLQDKNGDSKTSWKDLLEGRMAESTVYQSRASKKAEEAAIALAIYVMPISNPEKLKLWAERTGLKQAAYYTALRRKKG